MRLGSRHADDEDLGPLAFAFQWLVTLLFIVTVIAGAGILGYFGGKLVAGGETEGGRFATT